MTSTVEIETFLRRFEERAAPVEKAVSEAWWSLATTGTEEAQQELVRAGNEYNRLFSDKAEYEKVLGWYEDRGSLENPVLRRQVEVLYRTYAGNQGAPEVLERIENLEAKANATYSNHRGRGGRRGGRGKTKSGTYSAPQRTLRCAGKPGKLQRPSAVK